MTRPTSAPVSNPAPGDGSLLHAVQRALQGLPWHLGFPPLLEARMEADQDRERRRQLILGGLVALLVYDLFLVNDWLTRPEVLGVALWCRLGVVSGYGLLVLALIHRGLPARWREWLLASTLVVAMAASSEIFRHTRSAAGAYDPFVFSLVFMAGNVAMQLRFVPALVSSLLCVLVCLPFVLANPLLAREALSFLVGLLAGTAVFTSLACFRMERSARHSYLLVLQEALRSQAAQRMADRYVLISQTDALTSLANRRAFDEALHDAWLSAPRTPATVGLLVVDVDHFKAFNDHFGHPAGDACLRQVAAALRASLRSEDLVARIGGEEFAVLLCDTRSDLVAATAERLCRGVQALQLPHDGAAGRSVVTVSVGAALVRGADWGRPAALMEAADQALYRAKRNGRNRWAVAAGVGAGDSPAAVEAATVDATADATADAKA